MDLAGRVGQSVLAVAAGRVAFAGSVAGRGVVVVDHGALTSTYQPVSAYVSKGAHVSAGQPLGSLELIGSHCLPDACLHLGAKSGETYLDPLDLLPSRPVRLKPLKGFPPDPPGGIYGFGTQSFQRPAWGGTAGAAAGLSAAGGRGPPASS